MAHKKGTTGTTFVGNECPSLRQILLVGKSGATTLKGIYINQYGDQTGVAVSIAISATTPTVIHDGNTQPADACGFIGNLAGDCYYGLGALTAANVTDMTSNPTNYPILAAANGLRFGSVGL